MIWSRMKFEGRGSDGEFAPPSFTLIPFVFYMGRADSRVLAGLSAVVQPPVQVTYVIICVEMAKCVQCGRQLPALSFGKKLCQWCVQHEAAQRGEDSPIQRVEPAPWKRQQSSSMAVTQAIFGINVAVFVAMSLAVGVTVLGDPAWHELSVRLGANYGPYTLSGQWWRLLACVFIHGGLL